jgi:hypothetical protein
LIRELLSPQSLELFSQHPRRVHARGKNLYFVKTAGNSAMTSTGRKSTRTIFIIAVAAPVAMGIIFLPIFRAVGLLATSWRSRLVIIVAGTVAAVISYLMVFGSLVYGYGSNSDVSDRISRAASKMRSRNRHCRKAGCADAVYLGGLFGVHGGKPIEEAEVAKD